VARDTPQRLLELRCRKQEPAIQLRPFQGVSGQKAPVAVLLGEVHHDGDRLGQDQLTIDQYGDSAGRVDLQEFGPAMLPGHQVDGNRLEVDAQLL
jgi:hypothetical protein